MKCMTLAVAILLAVGCQAASLQADAPVPLPTYVQQLRGIAKLYIGQVKGSLDSIAEKINDQETKALIKGKLADIYGQLGALQTQLEPLTDGAAQTADEATRETRAAILEDFQNLKNELDPKLKELKDVVEKHLEEYKTLMQPVLEDYRAQHDEQMANLKSKMEPIVEDLRQKINVNVEETKSRLLPIIEMIREKVRARLEQARTAVDPYVQEYKEQMKAAYIQAQSMNYDGIREKLQPHFDTLRTGIQGIAQELQGLMGQ